MVDLNVFRDRFFILVGLFLAGVGFDELARDNGTLVGGMMFGGVGKLTLDDALAERAAVNFWPCLIKLSTGVAGFRGTTLNGKSREEVTSERRGRICFRDVGGRAMNKKLFVTFRINE